MKQNAGCDYRDAIARRDLNPLAERDLSWGVQT